MRGEAELRLQIRTGAKPGPMRHTLSFLSTDYVSPLPAVASASICLCPAVFQISVPDMPS